jgi:hypothetical protein
MNIGSLRRDERRKDWIFAKGNKTKGGEEKEG